MSAAAAPPHSDGEDEEEYRRPSKRLKTAARQTEEREEGEDELEEGEDSDSGSLPGEGESAVEHRARWTPGQYRGGRKVRAAEVSIRCCCQVTSDNRRARARQRAPPVSCRYHSFLLQGWFGGGWAPTADLGQGCWQGWSSPSRVSARGLLHA